MKYLTNFIITLTFLGQVCSQILFTDIALNNDIVYVIDQNTNLRCPSKNASIPSDEIDNHSYGPQSSTLPADHEVNKLKSVYINKKAADYTYSDFINSRFKVTFLSQHCNLIVTITLEKLQEIFNHLNNNQYLFKELICDN
jgi:hypothetical protein